jgi:predicted alpha/beta hydrolase family esterase
MNPPITMPVSSCDGITIAASRACKLASSRSTNVSFTVAGISLVATPDSESDQLVSDWFKIFQQQKKDVEARSAFVPVPDIKTRMG